MNAVRFNSAVSAAAIRLAYALKRTEALAGRRVFSCRVLDGLSGYNLSINCDLTVSCACWDYNGFGTIGDLRHSSLYEIFHGEPAMRYRKTLASGKLPLRQCAKCRELRMFTPKSPADHHVTPNWPPPGIMIENTIDCTLRCAICYRDQLYQTRRQSRLSLRDMEIVAWRIRESGIKYVSYYKLGEPFFSENIHQELILLREANPGIEIQMSTNGVQLDTNLKREAALLLDGIHFSIDGVDDGMVQKYQRGGSFQRAYRNMAALVEVRNQRKLDKPVIEWKYVLFRWNDSRKAVRTAVSLAQRAGVDLLAFWPTRSPVYGISWRYYLNGFFRTLGEPSWKGREIDFRKSPQEKGEM